MEEERKRKYEELLKGLDENIEEWSVPDWNGYEADPMCPVSEKYGREFLKLLYDGGFLLPTDILPCPSGETALNWEAPDANGYSVVVGINKEKKMTWGALTSKSPTRRPGITSWATGSGTGRRCQRNLLN